MSARALSIDQNAPRKSLFRATGAPTKKSAPFIAFLEPVNQPTRLNNCPEPHSDVALMADSEAASVLSLGALRADHHPVGNVCKNEEIRTQAGAEGAARFLPKNGE